MDDATSSSAWSVLQSSGTLTGVALLGLIVIAIVFAAQLEALVSACRNLLAYRRQLQQAQRKVEQETEAALGQAKSLQDELPQLQASVEALAQEYERLAGDASQARKLHIREVVMSDIFVAQGDRPFIATVCRPKPDPDEPLAEQWKAGRDHVLYSSDTKTAARRFAQRYPTDRGFAVGPVSPFTIPRPLPPEPESDA